MKNKAEDDLVRKTVHEEEIVCCKCASESAAIPRSHIGENPLWTSNACERSLLLYPPTRNCNR
jgi:hypothetical protein